MNPEMWFFIAKFVIASYSSIVIKRHVDQKEYGSAAAGFVLVVTILPMIP